jgi:hypothetical protein
MRDLIESLLDRWETKQLFSTVVGWSVVAGVSLLAAGIRDIFVTWTYIVASSRSKLM